MSSPMVIFNKLLTASFVPSDPFIISGGRVVLDFEFDITGSVEWFMEFASDDPNAAATKWHREVAEEDAGGGVVGMPVVVRTLTVGATSLNQDAQFVRSHQFCRIQIRAASVAPFPTAIVKSVFALPAQSP